MRLNAIILVAVALALLSSSVPASAQAGEREAFNAARRDGSIEAYEQFLAAYPRGYYTEQARLNRDDAVVRAYCRADVPLDLLVDYIEINQPHAPRIRTFYANLVNQPTHSFRFLMADLGFNGTTGTVTETVTVPKGSTRSVYVFDQRGLLVADTLAGFGIFATSRAYEYAYDNLHGYCLSRTRLTSGESAQVDETYEARYDAMDRMVALKSSLGKLYRFVYNEFGGLAEVQFSNDGLHETLTYNDGTLLRRDLRTDSGQSKVFRFTYDYNADTGKRYLNGVKTLDGNGEVTSDHKVSYTLDGRGRYSTISVTDGDKTLMTVTRTYSD